MNKPKNWENVKAATERQQLPKGGYVCKIMNTKVVECGKTNGKNGLFEMLEIALDILEGEYKDFYSNDYRQNPDVDKRWKGAYRLFVPRDDGSEKDEWTKSKLKAATDAVEESNPGYHWDWNEASLKGKTVGAVFRSEEYDFNGHQGFATRCFKLVPADNIRTGKFKVPEDKLLEKKVTVNPADFTEIPVSDSDLPF